MQIHWVVIALFAGVYGSAAFAGESATLRGQSDMYAVEFQDPLSEPDSMIEISEYVADDFGYVKKLLPIPFKSECKATKSEIRCKKNGKSPLAGARYRRTRDATPGCSGQADYRFTCVAGCTAVVPRYISISPWEC